MGLATDQSGSRVLATSEDATARDLQCLGLTANGHPPHPLYLPSTTPLRRLDAGACGTSTVGSPRDVVAANAVSAVLRRQDGLQEAVR